MGKQVSIVDNYKKKIKSHSTFTITLCEFCHKRNFKNCSLSILKYSTDINIQLNHEHTCFICENFFKVVLPSIIIKIDSQLAEFKNYKSKIDIGTTLPYRFYEKEDYIRSIFKIKGLVNIKNEINFRIREEIKRTFQFEIDHANPECKLDIVINEDLSFSVNSKNRQFYLIGRYKKLKRGIPQKIQAEKESAISGSNNNDTINYSKSALSVESFVLNALSYLYSTNAIKISWTGGEDRNSLVAGGGRPFIVKIKSNTPVIKYREFFKGDGMEIWFKKIEPKLIKDIHRYRQQVKVLVKLEEDFSDRNDLEEKVKSIVGKVKFEIKKKTMIRNIYESTLVAIEKNNLEIHLCLDNGIPIKQLIGGMDPIEPCFSRILGCKCECLYFDIMEFIQSN